MALNGRGKLFEYAVLYHPRPTKDENDRGVTPKSVVLTPPATVMAFTEDEAKLVAARSIPEEYTDRLSDIDIQVRPF